MCSVGVDTLKASFPKSLNFRVWYGLGLHYNTHGKYIVMETLYFLRIFSFTTNHTRMRRNDGLSISSAVTSLWLQDCFQTFSTIYLREIILF